MVESHRQNRDISLPLLSTPEDPHVRTNEGGSEEWTHSSSHGKYSKWVAFPFRRILHALLAVIALIALGFAMYGSFIGFHAYRKLVFPHRAVHASPATVKDGSRVVKPYFAPEVKGGVQSGTLLVKIWFKDGEKDMSLPAFDESRETDWEDMWRRERQIMSMANIGETGYVDDTLLGTKGQENWVEQFATEIPIKDIERTEDKVARVTLPGQTVQALVTKSRSLIVATFELLPDPATIPPSLSGEHRSTRPTSLYGPLQYWPLPYSPPDPIDDASLNAFFAHSGAGRSLKIRERDYRDARKDDGSWDLPRPSDLKYATFLTTRTWVTMSSEYSVYGVEQYTKAQDALREFKTTCANSTNYYDPMNECQRTFDRDGHFENLIIYDAPDATKQWRYGPFLTTRLSPTTPDDFLELPSEAEITKTKASDIQDFSFDWSIRYSAMSPAKLSLAQSTIRSSGIWGKMHPDSYSAKALDKEDLNRALLGLSIDLGSRPISRSVVQFISDGLFHLTIPLILHYWYTRRVSTGISLIPLVAQYIFDLIYYIVSCAVNMEYVWIFVFVIAIICFVAVILKQLYLLARPDFKIQRLEPSGLMYPSAVRFRLATVSESRSYKLDLKFDWRLRILLTIITFCILRFAPAPPAIISARKYSDIMQGFGGFQDYNSTVLTAIHILAAIRSSIWLTASLSQILLNQRNKSFAGLYALTAYLQFGSLLLSQVTRIFVRWFGRSQVMQPFTVWDIVMLVVSGVTVVQARTLPKVEQIVEETLD